MAGSIKIAQTVEGVGRVQSARFDSMDAFQDWSRHLGLTLDIQPTHVGPSGVSLRALDLGPLSLRHFQFECPAVRRGGYANNTVAIWLREGNAEGVWCGRDIGATGLSIFPDEFVACGRRPLNGRVIEVSRSFLEKMMASLEMDQRSIIAPGRSIDLDQETIQPLVRIHERLLGGDAGDDGDIAEQLTRQLLCTLDQSSVRRPAGRGAVRRKAFAITLEYIDAHAEEPLTSETLRSVTNASQRTLEYAFREYAGTTPLKYLKTVRLERVRKELRQGSQQSVADVANRWGFWHMGQFARDYRRQFGCRPFDDFRRAGRFSSE